MNDVYIDFLDGGTVKISWFYNYSWGFGRNIYISRVDYNECLELKNYSKIVDAFNERYKIFNDSDLGYNKMTGSQEDCLIRALTEKIDEGE
jgi:hypothetical protein